MDLLFPFFDDCFIDKTMYQRQAWAYLQTESTQAGLVGTGGGCGDCDQGPHR